VDRTCNRRIPGADLDSRRHLEPSATCRLEKTIAAIRATGQPLTSGELDQAYRASCTNDNSAKCYYKASFALLEEQQGQREKWQHLPLVGTNQLPRLGEKMPEELRREVEMYLAENEDALRLLEKAISMEIADSIGT